MEHQFKTYKHLSAWRNGDMQNIVYDENQIHQNKTNMHVGLTEKQAP